MKNESYIIFVKRSGKRILTQDYKNSEYIDFISEQFHKSCPHYILIDYANGLIKTEVIHQIMYHPLKKHIIETFK